MKKINISLFIVVLFCSSFSNQGAWVIDSDSKLLIHGATNVNHFTCRVSSYLGRDTLRYSINYVAREIQFTDSRMVISIRDFDCGSKQISRDFRNALRSDDYPRLAISFISLQNIAIKNGAAIKGIVDITLAGVTTRYGIQFVLHVNEENIFLSGIQPINFADFRLKAPEKLNGLIRVRDIVNVEFQMVLQAV